MAVSTQVTSLSYSDVSPLQVETLIVVGTITTAGNATVVFTSRDVVGSPITIPVAVANTDSDTVVAGKVRTALNANVEIGKVFTIGGTGANVVVTRINPTSNDVTLNISITNGTCAGLTAVPSSTNTTAGATYASLVDIVNYPDMGSAPSKLDTTTLSEAKYKTSILGLQEVPDLTFEANYDKDVYNTISAITGEKFFELKFSTTDGIFNWKGQVAVYANGAGVDEVRKMTVVLSASTPITFSLGG